jgi:rifampicin phosphotransferase
MGLDLWSSFLKKIKPQYFVSEGKDGLMWNIGGRQYMHMSNFLRTVGARKIILATDPSVARVFDSVDLDGEYIPSKMPIGVKGVFWLHIKQICLMLPNLISAFFAGEKAMAAYDRASEAFFALCQDEDYMRDETLDEVLACFLAKFLNEMLSKSGGLLTAMYSSWRLDRIFSQLKEAENLLLSLKMDLRGNPTSAMGHAMVRLASYQEVQQTGTGDEFVLKLKQTGDGGCGSFSDEFKILYNDYMKRYGCRGMRETDPAISRTSEKEADFFQQLKQIDLHQNAINSVTERRQEAYDKLLKMARDIGYKKSFKNHASIVHALLGYREHPKYMYVVMVSMFRRRALKLGQLFVERGRLERVEQIFDLTFDQIAKAQRDPDMALAPIIEANLKPYQATAGVKNWPIFIDSRGKIIQEPRKEYNAKEGLLWGDPISPGVVKGKARVLNEPYEAPLLAGEILVARFTEPSWTPIFINAAGVVMEVGGPLQHGAVIAREYGLPCVSGVDHATTIIKNGDELQVDGSTGAVTILNWQSEKVADTDATKHI